MHISIARVQNTRDKTRVHKGWIIEGPHVPSSGCLDSKQVGRASKGFKKTDLVRAAYVWIILMVMFPSATMQAP